ncbi:MAG: glycosyltransferase [Nanoarchaeota archaeon]
MKLVIFIPLRNEEENISLLVKKIESLHLKDYKLLLVNDVSTDKTSQIIEKLAKQNKEIIAIHRTTNPGRGRAGITGLKKALELKPDYIIEMDGDLSHNPKYIPNMLKEIKNYDVIIGSRKQIDSDKRNHIRKYLTKLSVYYFQKMLGIKLSDPNSGFRCFRRQVIESIINSLESTGFSITTEILFKITKKQFKIKEIPIIFEDRKKGKSKLKIKDLIKSFFRILKYKIII